MLKSILPILILSQGLFVSTGEAMTRTEIQYTESDHYQVKTDKRFHMLDVYCKDKCKENRPVLFVIHGGGFVGGDKRDQWVPKLASFFVDQGYHVVAPNYRLSLKRPNQGVYPFPAAPNDVLKSYEWVLNNGSKYNLNSKRVCVLGFSAGASLALSLSRSKTPPRCILSYSAITNFLREETWGAVHFGQKLVDYRPYYLPTSAIQDPHESVDRCEKENLLKRFDSEKRQEIRPILKRKIQSYLENSGLCSLYYRASPVFQIQSQETSLFIVHGTKDNTVTVENAGNLDWVAKHKQIPSKIYLVKGVGHHFGKLFSATHQSALKFIRAEISD